MLLVADDPRFSDHDPGPGHPERPARSAAVRRGLDTAGFADAYVPLEPREATIDELARVHREELLETLTSLDGRGGGRIDADTRAGPGSFGIARRAAGAGLAAIDALDAGRADAAFLAVRPPGHHATAGRSMGFCLVNNVAVAAAALADRGERVAIVDVDAHHGNGTQDIFWNDPRVAYVSFHEWPLYPGTGRIDERGGPDAPDGVCNLPLPSGATGDVYLEGLDRVVAPFLDAFAPGWMLLSLGFDAHRDDPLTGLALSAGDYGVLVQRLAALAPRPGRTVAFLEGGYDLDALTHSTAATVPGLLGIAAGREPVEPTTGGGPGSAVVSEAVRRRAGRA